MTDKSRWQQISSRNWEDIAAAWVDAAASIPDISQKPDPGLERLPGLLSLDGESPKRHDDVEGLRIQCFWESLYLYSKCDHAMSASQRLASIGMASWSNFNAYHSAYLGARGILGLLGVPLPNLAGRQVFLDLFPAAERKSTKYRGVGPSLVREFLIKNVPKLDQRAVWACLQRVLRVSKVQVWNVEFAMALDGFEDSEITPPRNHFLYKPAYWLFDDLLQDLPTDYDWLELSDPIVATDRSFLLWLCFVVHNLFTALVKDLASQSELINQYLQESRGHRDSALPEQQRYRALCISA